MTASPEKAAPIPADDAVDTVAGIVASNAGRKYVISGDLELAAEIVEALADREARPSLPDSREEQIRADGQGFVQLPDGWLAIELRAVEEELEKWPAGLRASFESLLHDRARARQGGSHG